MPSIILHRDPSWYEPHGKLSARQMPHWASRSFKELWSKLYTPASSSGWAWVVEIGTNY